MCNCWNSGSQKSQIKVSSADLDLSGFVHVLSVPVSSVSSVVCHLDVLSGG